MELIPGKDTSRVSDAERHNLDSDQVAAMRESLGKCINPATGRPVSARREDEAVLPVQGSVTESEDGNGRGTCPECSAHVRLSGKGFLTAHNVRKNPVPAPPPAIRLAERQVETTDTGARGGSPDASMRKREAELGAASGTATVPVKATVKDNCVQAKVKDAVTKTVTLVMVEGVTPESINQDERRSQLVEVPATAANIRTAIRQEQAKEQKPVMRRDPVTGERTPTGEMSGGPDFKLLAKLGSMLKGVTGLAAMPVLGAEPGTYRIREAVTLDAPNAPEGREERQREDGSNGHVPTAPGPALVQGANMRPEEPKREGKNGKPRNAAGWSAPLGRPRPDRVALIGDADVCQGRDCKIIGCVGVVGGRYGYLECHVYRSLSKSRQRRYWEHVGTSKRRAESARAHAAMPILATGRGQITGKAMGGAAIRRV